MKGRDILVFEFNPPAVHCHVFDVTGQFVYTLLEVVALPIFKQLVMNVEGNSIWPDVKSCDGEMVVTA